MKIKKGLEMADENFENVGGGWYIEKRPFAGNGWSSTSYYIIDKGHVLGSADSWAEAYEKVRELELDMKEEEVDKEEWRNHDPFQGRKKDHLNSFNFN